ncbi:phage major tail protein, TP901-1 family [Virgibacillus pantothenticus]|uniref:phage major tail protein, TP901-1 family n=1 Tax=Virgibacillus pantothenticus TaxID=1473 RepID=UPI00098639D3|nr:phage major tail protein, TP901-1 family [Virgibacillus pantothenticus]
MAVEFKGEEFLYLIEIPAEGENPLELVRLWNQTSGSRTIEAASVDLATKDKSGSDYGTVTESVSVEGIRTEGDRAYEYIEESIRGKRLVKIHRLNKRDLSTESGYYMLSNLEDSSSVDEYATYSVEATLNGKIKKDTVTEIPEGAPDEGQVTP